MFRKPLLVTGYWLLITATLPPQARAGWLLWEAPKEVASPAAEKIIYSAKEPADLTSEFVFSPSGKEKLPANLIFFANLSDLRSFSAAVGWTECETRLFDSIGQALKKLYSGRKPTNFLPAKSWLLGGKTQDLSFCGAQGNQFEIYFWRLPFRGQGGTPFWAGAVYGTGAQDTFNAALKNQKVKKSKIKNARSAADSAKGQRQASVTKNEVFLISLR